MDKKRILIVSASFFPQNSPRSFRTTELAKEFERQGHEVVIYIPYQAFDYSDFVKEFPIKIKYLGSRRFKPIELKGKSLAILIRRALRRGLGLLCEYPDIELMSKVSKHLKKESGYDLLISIAVPYPIHWGVAHARSNRNQIGKIWVADCGDPYVGCRTDTFRKPFYFKYIEKWFCRKATYISVPHEDHMGQYYPEFYSKIRAIPQGFRFEDSKIYSDQIKHDIPTFAYAGVLLKHKRDPTNLLQYLSEKKMDFRFILYTKDDRLLRPFKKRLGDKLDIRNYIRREELIYELSKMDFLLNIEFHSSVRSNSPSKLIDYAITGRPILSINMEEMDVHLINEFLTGNYNRKMKMNNSDKFRIENVAAQFLRLLN